MKLFTLVKVSRLPVAVTLATLVTFATSATAAPSTDMLDGPVLNVKKARFRIRPDDPFGIGQMSSFVLGATMTHNPPGVTADRVVLRGTLEFTLRGGDALIVPVYVRMHQVNLGVGFGFVRGDKLKLRIDNFRGQTLRDLMTTYRGGHATAVFGAGLTYYHVRSGDEVTMSGWNPRQGFLFDLMLNDGISISPTEDVPAELLDSTLL